MAPQLPSIWYPLAPLTSIWADRTSPWLLNTWIFLVLHVLVANFPPEKNPTYPWNISQTLPWFPPGSHLLISGESIHNFSVRKIRCEPRFVSALSEPQDLGLFDPRLARELEGRTWKVVKGMVRVYWSTILSLFLLWSIWFKDRFLFLASLDVRLVYGWVELTYALCFFMCFGCSLQHETTCM